MTLRSRLLVALVILLATAVVITDVTAVTALRRYLVAQMDDQLEAATQPLLRRSGPIRELPSNTPRSAVDGVGSRMPPGGPDPVGLSNFYIEIRGSDGTTETRLSRLLREENEPPPVVSEEVARARSGQGPFTIDSEGDGSFRYRVIVATAQDGSGTVILAAPLENIDDIVNSLITVEVVATLAVLSLLVLAGWFVIRADLRPLEQMTDTATAIAAGDLSRRIERSDDKSEVGRLGSALNTMLARIETSLTERQRTADRLRQFAADASHELRTPLTAIRGYAELHRQGAVTDEEHLRRIMSRIESESKRMGIIVDDLLLLARMDQGRPIEKVTLDLNAVVSDAVTDARAADPARTVNYERGDEIQVLGDAPRLHQVLSNLLSNALTHTPPEKAVHVTVGREDTEAVVAVRDEGPGLASGDQAKVFERFYRVDTGRSREQGGTGLGLAIVKSLVEAHGGTVSVESVPGEGATFSFRLPLPLPSQQGRTTAAVQP